MVKKKTNRKKPKRKPGRKRKLKPVVLSDQSPQKKELRDNFIWLGTTSPSDDHPAVISMIEDIFQQMKSAGLVPSQPKYADGVLRHVRIVLCSLCGAFFSDDRKSVAYHRAKDQFNSGTEFYNKDIKYPALVDKLVPFLHGHGYIEDYSGVFFSNSSWASRMRATKRLKDLVVQKHRITYPMFRQTPRSTLVSLKGEKYEKTFTNKKGEKDTSMVADELEYVDTDDTLRMKGNLKLINKVIEDNIILLEVSDQDLDEVNNRMKRHVDRDRRKGGSLDFTSTQLHRTFNNVVLDAKGEPVSLTQGGRFFSGWWQRVPNKRKDGSYKRYRSYITINGFPTREPDFSGLHINMLYARKGLSMPEGDVYELEGYDNTDTFRDFAKRMLLVIVNAHDESQVRDVLHKEVYKKNKLILPISEGIKSTGWKHIRPLMQAFEKKHSDISEDFCSGAGIDLMNYDSQIAETVMLHFARKGIPCLPIHDSFRVDMRYEDELIEVMRKAFKDMFDQECGVGVKRKFYDDDRSVAKQDFERTIAEYPAEHRDEVRQAMLDAGEAPFITRYSRYEKMLAEFSEAKGVRLPEVEIRIDGP